MDVDPESLKQIRISRISESNSNGHSRLRTCSTALSKEHPFVFPYGTRDGLWKVSESGS